MLPDTPTPTIPNNWHPRHYQLDALKAFERGLRRQSHIWHRRAGKDSFSLNLSAIQSQLVIGQYWHLFPLQVQARRSIWHGIGADGKRFLDQAFPQSLRQATRSQEMQIELTSGSIWQMAGSDHYDSLVGSNVRGVIFSEWALCDPRSWDYIRPILRENDGWAIFITTYRGKNHAWTMHRKVKDNPEWFCSTYDVTQTRRANGKPVLTQDDIQAERDEGMSEDMIQQEYYCSPMAAFAGAFYAKAMRAMVKDRRITAIPYDPTLSVVCCFDLGMDDHTAIIYIQENGAEVRIIGSDSYRFTGIPDIVDAMAAKPWKVEYAIMPHDVNVTSLSTGKSRRETFEKRGLATRIAPMLRVQEGIEATRNILPRVWIDEANNFSLIEALTGYRTDETSQAGVFQKTPLHSWESHYADAFRMYAVYQRDKLGPSKPLDYSKLRRATR